MKILLTGGSSFTGLWFARSLAAAGHRITAPLRQACADENGLRGRRVAALRATGVQLLNQSVLLAGVNDRDEVLTELSWQLHRAGVLPYYLHLPDRVRGTAHFDVDESRGVALIDVLARRLPGYLVPRLVREIPGEEAKFVVAAGLRRS